MTARNRSQAWLVMACASCCWLGPLPPEWLARVYGLDPIGETSGEPTSERSGDTPAATAEDMTIDLVAAGRSPRSPAGLPTAGLPTAGLAPTERGQSRGRTGRRWGFRRTAPVPADL